MGLFFVIVLVLCFIESQCRTQSPYTAVKSSNKNVQKLGTSARSEIVDKNVKDGKYQKNATLAAEQQLIETSSYVVVIVGLPNGGLKCGGTLISARHVLTAAHCVTKTIKVKGVENYVLHRRTLVKVQIDPSQAFGKTQVMFVKKIKVHPDYMKHFPTKRYKDIALITLKSCINTKKIKPAAIFSRLSVALKNNTLGQCKAVAWLDSPAHKQGGARLIKTIVPILTANICNMYINRSNLIHNTEHICAIDSIRNYCDIFSSAHLYCLGKVLAIESWSINCSYGYPSVFSRVDNAVGFIKMAKLGAQSISSSYLTTFLISFFIHFLFSSLFQQVIYH